MKRAILILWPSFIVGGIAGVAFFLALDAAEPGLLDALDLGRMAGYTLGFFFFWSVAAASSAFTCFLQKGADEVNR